MAANMVCSDTGNTAHMWDGPSYYLPGQRRNNVVVRCGRMVKVAVVISMRESREKGYVICPDERCTPQRF